MRISVVIKGVLITLAAVYLVVLVGMYLGQRRLLYFPDPTRRAPDSVGLKDVIERIIDTPDGHKIIAWHGAARPGQPTLLYLHGNGASLAGRSAIMRKYLAHGRGVFIMAYRGYSGSTGSPTETANVADAKLAFDTLVRDGVKPADIILYGESLGTGVAVQVALEKPAAGIILDSPYTAVVDRAAELYPWLPVRLLAVDRYESRRHIAGMRMPLLIVHGEADQVLPVAMGRRLFALANEPKQLVTVPGAGHNNHDLFGSFEAIGDWIDRLRAGRIKR
jgi:uncharacterized protein